MKYKGKAYTFDDVSLVPQFNNIESRTEPDLTSWLTKSLPVPVPIVNAPMDTVINGEMAKHLWDLGTYPIFHRYDKDIDKTIEGFYPSGRCVVSMGFKDFDKIKALVERFNKKYVAIEAVLIDVAHGHSAQMLEMIGKVKKEIPGVDVIAGNVCTAQGYQDLAQAGADAIRVGIGPGAACSTRGVTGHGVPQFSAILECAEVASKLRVPIIADGGIRGSSDIVKALAAGASTVMIGSLLAGTHESPAEKRPSYSLEYSGMGLLAQKLAEPKLARYRGHASFEFQNDQYGGLKEGTVPEGVDGWVPISGSVKELFDTLLGGLRSGLTYGGARSIKELQRKAEFVSVQGSALVEASSRVK